jgi:phosphoglycolate phosphatase
MKVYGTILFDLDGTLTDPKQGMIKSFQYALSSFEIENTDLSVLEKCIGPPLQDSFPEYFGFSRKDTEMAIKKYREYFSERGLFENEVYGGIPELLEALREDGRTPIASPAEMNVMVNFQKIWGDNVRNPFAR